MANGKKTASHVSKSAPQISILFRFLVFLTIFFLFGTKNASAVTIRCAYSSFANACQIQFGATCPSGTHPEQSCPFNCSSDFDIQCISDSIPTPVPTPQPTDCDTAGGSCQQNDPSLCTGSLIASPQCAPQIDSTGSSYRCCTPSQPPPSSGGGPIPGLRFPCKEDSGSDPEFHSLRPYQAAHCGDANKALYCSNDLKFLETFDVKGYGNCVPRHVTDTFTCSPNFTVNPHTLNISLDDSMFPIMGNTEQVKNSTNTGDEYDDATKMNEYVSWYLSGVNLKAEYGVPTVTQTVDFSGPVQKLLPKLIQEAERIKTIDNAKTETSYTDDETAQVVKEPLNHNQIVACTKKEWWFFGPVTPVPCYSTVLESKYRLLDWDTGTLGIGRDLTKAAAKLAGMFPGLAAQAIEDSLSSIWDNRKPPLPWDDGTGKPFESQAKYQKAYNEWKGKTCIILPLVGTVVCIDLDPTNIFVNSEWSEMYQYIPLSNTTDKKGAERVMDVQPAPVDGTQIGEFSYGEVRSPPLYFAHTQEVRELSELLNKTYTPMDCKEENGVTKCEPLKNEKLPQTTEKNYCSVVNVRVNKGDNLFPGDPDEMQVPDITYPITQAKCKEKYEWVCKIVGRGTPFPHEECGFVSKLECTAQVYITIKTKTKTPNADEIFSTTVADSGSTFRRIFPKVGEGAPISCIADIPTVTNVTYDASGSQAPPGGDLEFIGAIRFPEDGAGDAPQLTFPHIGSIYEYFLKGIQTALRPKGYGEPITNGALCNNVKCGELPELPPASGSCKLGGISSRVGNIPQSLKDIVSAAAETYKVPPNLILGIMYGEGLFGGGNEKDWTDENVNNWSTCEPVPNCNQTGDDNFMGFNGDDWKTVSEGIKDDLHKLDPNINQPDVCNLLHAVYGVAWNLHDSADGGGPSGGIQCFGLDLHANIPTSCSWNDNQYESAIKIAENGYDLGCFTLPGSCEAGGGNAALCDNGVDGCETLQNPGARSSHNACIWDVGHGN